MAGAVELYKSRRVVPNTDGVTVIRFYAVPKSELGPGASGWVASTGTALPVVGDSSTWTGATWSLFATSPTVETVDIDPRSTAATAIVRVVARASRVWAD